MDFMGTREPPETRAALRFTVYGATLYGAIGWADNTRHV